MTPDYFPTVEMGGLRRRAEGEGLVLRGRLGEGVGIGVCGVMDNASDYESEDSRFKSWHARSVRPY